MNSIILFKKAIFRVTILLFYIEFISISFANNPTITGIYPLQGTDENGQISLLGANFKEIKQVLFQTSSGIVAVPQIIDFKDYLKVYFVPKDAVNSTISVVGTFGIISTKVHFIVGVPSITGMFYSTDKEGKNYLIMMGENLNFIEHFHFKTINEEPATGIFNNFGAYAQVYIPRNAKNGIISISGSSFGRLNTKHDFINTSLHIPEHIENNDTDMFLDSSLINNSMIYPNPSSGNFMVCGNQKIGINDIKIIDYLGNNISFIYQNNELKITKSGVYFIHIHGKKIKAVVY